LRHPDRLPVGEQEASVGFIKAKDARDLLLGA